jgi:tyrosyl-tRNA synthetase
MNPRDAKFQLAEEIITRFHSAADARQAHANFIARFQKGAIPDEMDELTLDSQDGVLGIAHVLKGAGLTGSTSDAFRMLKQGAVRIDGERVEDRNTTLAAGSEQVIQVGKRRFARVTIR